MDTSYKMPDEADITLIVETADGKYTMTGKAKDVITEENLDYEDDYVRQGFIDHRVMHNRLEKATTKINWTYDGEYLFNVLKEDYVPKDKIVVMASNIKHIHEPREGCKLSYQIENDRLSIVEISPSRSASIATYNKGEWVSVEIVRG